MAPYFNYPETTEAWIPLNMSLEVTGHRGNYSFSALARLKPGVTLAQAQADMAAVSARLAQDYPSPTPMKERT